MKRGLMVLALAGATMVGSAAMAQEQPGQGPEANREQRDRSNRGDRRRFDPAQMRQQRLERIKEQLNPSVEEWQVLQPLVDKVFAAQRDAMAWGGRGGGGPERAGDQPETELQRASRELRSAVQDGADEASIQQKLTAYRAAHQKATEGLEAARKELRELVTPRQEAVLVVNGILE